MLLNTVKPLSIRCLYRHSFFMSNQYKPLNPDADTAPVSSICTAFLSYAQLIKGQIISKGLFGILGFFQKTNARIRF